jgi:hypothetical protein
MPTSGSSCRNRKEIVVFRGELSKLFQVRRITSNWVGCAIAVWALGAGLLMGNVDTNPYATIVDRNPFALKPPPPPPAPPEQTAPPVPMAKVTLTGLLSTFGEPRVLLEIIEDGGKGAAGTAKKPILREGEREGSVEVLSIDVVKNTVRLRNSGVETNITFTVAKSSGPAPGGPGVPGAPPAFTPPPINVPQPQNPQASAGGVPPGNQGGGGVTLMGNNAAAPGAFGTTADSGMRTIPSRPLRTENMTKEQSDLLMEVNRMREQQTPNPNPAFPRLPYNPRGGPPPVPGQP